ncbi:MAG: SUMF1/EgtB/PvdO family nonheme iron enzyme [Pseudomonadota bacterium]
MNNPHQQLGRLNHLHQLLQALLESVPDEETRCCYHSQLQSLAWYFGRAVYLETLLLRTVVQGEDGLAERVAHIFGDERPCSTELTVQIPPREHLLNWALEIFEENLTRLANPMLLPDHPLLKQGWLTTMLVQLHSKIYERMLEVLTERTLQQNHTYSCLQLLQPANPQLLTATVRQGHYRIGATRGVVFDNELPRQITELHSYRISKSMTSNANWLAFMQAGGYQDAQWWDEAGDSWRLRHQPQSPHHWRNDADNQWYGIGQNGPADLVPEDPVYGISLHEAHAYCSWLGSQEGFDGAAIQHEFQWELAARQGEIGQTGRVREWCWNAFEPYVDYEPPDIAVLATAFDQSRVAVRGATLHTQSALRRASYRDSADPGDRHHLVGLRLVFPPLPEVWHT